MKEQSIEERKLLLKDICVRIPYGVRVGMGVEIDANNPYILLGVNPTACGCAEIYVMRGGITCDGSLNAVKPYLRPMSSMTEEEFQELHSICPHSTFNKTNVPGWIIGIDGSEYGRISRIDEISKLLDWLNAHHFDYRGLIEKGLALEATEGMYNI